MLIVILGGVYCTSSYETEHSVVSRKCAVQLRHMRMCRIQTTAERFRLLFSKNPDGSSSE